MKHIFVIISLLCLIFTGNAQGFRSTLNIGIPINKSTNWSSANYDIDFLFNGKVSNNSLLGVGSSYLAVDLLQSNMYLTFDRKIFSFFSLYIYEINLSEKIKLLPQFRIGYSFVNSKLNEFVDKEQKTRGVYIAGGLYSGFDISQNIDLLAGFGYSMIFSKFETSPNIIITDNYIKSNKNTINQFIAKIGCAYKF